MTSYESNTSSGSWHPMNECFYRKFDVYLDQGWGPVFDLSKYHLTAAPYGGPIALTRDEKKLVAVGDSQLRPTIKIFTLAGDTLSESVWKTGHIAGFGWTDAAVLLVISEEGTVTGYSPLGRVVGQFELRDALKSGETIVQCQVWGTGLAALTTEHCVVCATFHDSPDSLGSMPESSEVFRLYDTGLSEEPISWLAVPPETPTDTPMALLAGTSAIVAVDPATARDNTRNGSPVSKMCLSPNRQIVALFAAPLVEVFSIDLTQNLAQFDTQSQVPPDQMAWCGNDSVVLYWESLQLVLVVGPHGEWIKFQYDTPLHLISECDGLRIVTNEKSEFLERVPDPTCRVFGLGSLDPGAMLYAALEQYDAKSPKADENIRSIRSQLSSAVDTCVAAATAEFGRTSQRSLMRAAALGKAFLDPVAPDSAFVGACRLLRVLNAVRSRDVGIPMTSSQLEKATVPGLLALLAGMHKHLAALRICESLDIPQQAVLTHWAIEKVACAPVGGDDMLVAAQILAALRDRGAIPYARIADAAFRYKHRELATRLVECEPRASEQVPLLVDMGMEDLALQKALDSGDIDLAYTVILHLLSKKSTGWFEAIRSKPLAVDLLVSYLRSKNDVDMLMKIYRLLEMHGALAAHLARTAMQSETFEGIAQGLYDVRGIFAAAPKESMAAQARLAEDHTRLLLAQKELEIATGESLFGCSLADTILRLLLVGDVKNAGHLRSDFKVSDKKWWWLRLKAIAENKDTLTKFGLLERLAKEKKSPIGYEPFVDVCIAAKVNEEASKYIGMIPEVGKRVPYYIQVGKLHEAAEAALKDKNPQLLQTVLDKCKTEQERAMVESFMSQLRK